MDSPPTIETINKLSSDGLKVLALVDSPTGEADKDITFISVRTSRLPTARCAVKGGVGFTPYIIKQGECSK